MEAEQGLLGSILLDARACMSEIEARGSIAEVFYDLRHTVIYEAILELQTAGNPVDCITLTERLNASNMLEQVGGIVYLSALPDATPSAANVSYYLDILLEKFAQRKIIQTLTGIVSSSYESEIKPAQMIDQAGQVITELSVRFNGRHKSEIRETVAACISDYEAEQNEGVIAGLTTGFIDYDKLTGGLKAAEYVVIAGRPSMGKTALAMNIVEHVALDLKQPVGIFSLEMSEKALVDRLICSRARINRKNIRDRMLAERDYPKLTGAAGKISASPIHIDDSSGLTAMQMRSRARQMHQEFGIKLLVVDYLQLISTDEQNRRDTRDAQIARVSAHIKGLLKELGIPGIILAQLNRDIEKDKSRKPRLSDLRECGAIEQDADTIGMLYKPSEEEEEFESANPINLCIRKQRSGPTGDIHLTFFSGWTRFESAAKISDTTTHDNDH